MGNKPVLAGSGREGELADGVGRVRSPAFLSILRDHELFHAERLFVWVLGSEPDDDRVIPLPHVPRVHIIGKAPRN